MAKKATKKNALDMAKLGSIAAENAKGSYPYMSQAEYEPYVAAGVLEINNDPSTWSDGKPPVRVNDKGLELLNAPQMQPQTQQTNAGSVSAFTLENDIAVPEIVRFGGGRKAKESIYPFETMQPGQSFFVPPTADKPKPWQSMASNVSSFNRKYAVEKGTFHTEKRTQYDADGNPVLDANGKKVKVDTQVPDLEYTRRYEVRRWEQNGIKGARVWRTK